MNFRRLSPSRDLGQRFQFLLTLLPLMMTSPSALALIFPEAVMVKRGCWPAGTVVTILTEITSALATAGSASAKATIATVRAWHRAACMTRNLSPSKRTALQNQSGRLIVEGDEQR